MRALMIAFLILSPFIAIAQSYHLQPATLPDLVQAPAHYAHALALNAGQKMGNMMHAVQALLG